MGTDSARPGDSGLDVSGDSGQIRRPRIADLVRAHADPVALGRAATVEGEDKRRTTRRRRPPRWGVVRCPDGQHRIDLAVMSRAMTRLLVAGELSDQPILDVARKAGLSRSTVSRMFSGTSASLRTLLTVLAVLGLAFEDVVSDTPLPTERAIET
jgi:AraC-like DNA-binding protein